MKNEEAGRLPGFFFSFSQPCEAQRPGYELYERTIDGYLVRTRTDNGWAHQGHTEE